MTKRNTSSTQSKRIGLLGGTFDPIHNGHLSMAKVAIASGLVQEVWFLPNPTPPHKQLPENVPSMEDRMQMVALAIAEEDAFSICDLELHKKSATYTYQTLEMLEERYPECSFAFMIGGDSLFQIETWKCPELLLPGRLFLAAQREENKSEDILLKAEELNRKYGSDIQLLSMPSVDVSSTDIRNLCHQGKSISAFVPKSVEDYIAKKGLYR